jgi:hypothetical protein
MILDLKNEKLNTLLYFYVSLFAFYFSVNLLNGLFKKYTPGIYNNLTLLLILSLVFAMTAAHLAVPETDEKKLRKAGLATAAVIAE